MSHFLVYIDEIILTMDEDYLLSFVRDFAGLFSIVWAGIQCLLGLSYISGKYLIESTIVTSNFLLSLGSSFLYFLEALTEQLAEFVYDILKCVLLIYYGVFKIIEAFYTTFTDLIWFIAHMGATICHLAQDGFQFVFDSIISLNQFPKLLYDGLILLSDTFVSCFSYGLAILHDFVTQLIWSPINAITMLTKFSFHLVGIFIRFCGIVYNAFWEIPLSVHFAILILTMIYFMYRKLSVWTVFKSAVKIIRHTFKVCGRIGKFFSTVMARYFKVHPSELEDPMNGSASSTSDRSLKGMCVICQEEPVCYISNPCCHVCLCKTCVHKLVKTDNRCPLCRNVVENFTKVYIS